MIVRYCGAKEKCNFASKTQSIMLSNKMTSAIAPITAYLKSQPVERAWLFGSCSRGEETPASDVDILVDYLKDARITLFTISRMALRLKDITGREVDLVERDCLLPFAAESVEKDKRYL